jgi:hypothetical protein
MSHNIKTNSTQWMREIAKRCNMQDSPITKMTLVLVPDEMPKLLVECLINKSNSPLLPTMQDPNPTKTTQPFDTTSMQNKEWRTFAPKLVHRDTPTISPPIVDKKMIADFQRIKNEAVNSISMLDRCRELGDRLKHKKEQKAEMRQ